MPRSADEVARPDPAARPGTAARSDLAARPGTAARSDLVARPGTAARSDLVARPGTAARPGVGVAALRRVTVLGTGLIGTSVALALRRAGVRVALSDRDPDAVAEARGMGAGVELAPEDPPADLVVIATPPATVVDVLRDAQRRGLGAAYTDVASTKARIVAGAEHAGCDLTTYVPGHPMAGRELSGPAAARADLFDGRPWTLCPQPAVAPGPLCAVAELVGLCGAKPVVLAAGAHDLAVAAVSHAPHVVSAALAARFARADRDALSLVGKGLLDTTRIAAGAPDLWCDILGQNAEPVAEVLEEVARDLADAAHALRTRRQPGAGALADLLTMGNRGRERIVDAGSAGRVSGLGFRAPEGRRLREAA